jgi:pimeloyl-ACP methyl ester carboxylesterase
VMERLADLTMPLALVIGDGDRAFLGANDYLERKLPHAHRTTVEGARHFVMRSHPESVADAVATVIAELEAEN